MYKLYLILFIFIIYTSTNAFSYPTYDYPGLCTFTCKISGYTYTLGGSFSTYVIDASGKVNGLNFMYREGVTLTYTYVNHMYHNGLNWINHSQLQNWVQSPGEGVEVPNQTCNASWMIRNMPNCGAIPDSARNFGNPDACNE
jgi:hypothetical protein